MAKITDLYSVAIDAVLQASVVILEIYRTDFGFNKKEDGSPVTMADLASSKIIQECLATTDIPITGEETIPPPYSIRKNWKKLWCVDPLDGTKEFLKKNNEFVINIALIEYQQPVFGLIASPIRQQILIGNKEMGVFQFSYENAHDTEKWEKISPLQTIQFPIHLISSRSHFSGNSLKLIQFLEEKNGTITTENMGSALKFFELAHQRATVYPRFAPTMEWDIAAGQAIYGALGGKIVTVKTGQPLIYNKENLRNPYFIGFHPDLEGIEEFIKTHHFEEV